MRHKSWSFNETSGRYVEFDEKFFYPEKWRLQDENVKQGSKEDTESKLDQLDIHSTVAYSYNNSLQTYRDLLKSGVAKEQARMVLPLGLITQLYATCSLRSIYALFEIAARQSRSIRNSRTE